METHYRNVDCNEQQPVYISAATAHLLMKKTWCHGQVIAAAQGIGYAYWGLFAPDLDAGLRVVLVLGALLLPTWSVISWRAMKGRTLFHARVILGFGVVNLVFYSAVLAIAATDLASNERLIIFIFTLLQMVETSAYLLVVCCLRRALVDDDADEQLRMV